MKITDEIAMLKNTHLMEWLKQGYDHCQRGSKDWCEAYLNSAHDYILALEAAVADVPDGVAAPMKQIDDGRFEEWSLADFAAQCRMQSREQLDPEFSAFMGALGERLSVLAAPEPVNGDVPVGMMQELKPCPFCSGTDLTVMRNDGIICRGCHVQVLGSGNTRDIETWNRRPAPEPTKDDESLWRDKAQEQAKTIVELRETLSEYVCACTGLCHAEAYGGPCGRAAFAALNAEGK